jgi:gas vesicle protein
MKLQDIKDIDKDDVLGLLGLATKHSNSHRLITALGTFGVGLLVGASVALLLAPKAGRELRQDLRTKLRRDCNGVEASDCATAASSSEQAT